MKDYILEQLLDHIAELTKQRDSYRQMAQDRGSTMTSYMFRNQELERELKELRTIPP